MSVRGCARCGAESAAKNTQSPLIEARVDQGSPTHKTAPAHFQESTFSPRLACGFYSLHSLAMPKSPRPLAIRICKAVYDLKGSQLHWVTIDEVCRAMDLAHTEAMDAALAYASDQGLLACNPPPVHSIMLTPKGETAARGKIRK